MLCCFYSASRSGPSYLSAVLCAASISVRLQTNAYCHILCKQLKTSGSHLCLDAGHHLLSQCLLPFHDECPFSSSLLWPRHCKPWHAFMVSMRCVFTHRFNSPECPHPGVGSSCQQGATFQQRFLASYIMLTFLAPVCTHTAEK